ncbi:MAG: hypothetical protein AB7I48_21330 [Planctomycetaceae bacterium]
MESTNNSQAPHAQHAMRGPHFGGRLTPDQRAEVLRWLEETEEDPGISVRDVARFIAGLPPLEKAVLGSVRSAYLGGLEPSSTTHAVALLGLRLARRQIRTFVDAPLRAVRSPKAV